MPSRYSREEAIIKCKLSHPNSSYIYHEETYINYRTKMKITCNIHGDFFQSPNSHKQGHGCPKCAKIKISQICDENNKKNTIPFQTMINRFNKVHNNLYQYVEPKIFKGYRQKIEIICPMHGIFIQQTQSHLNGSGCPNCSNSKGSNKIEYFLKQNNIKIEKEKTFENCRNIFILKFDFYLPDYNTCIEFDGKQHFEPVQYGGIDYKKAQIKFKNQQINDKIKNEYCLKNSIRLIRIPHWNFKKIEIILEKELS